MSWLFAWGGHSIKTSVSVFPMNTQSWFPVGWLSWTLCCEETLKSLLQHHDLKASNLQCSAFFMVQLSHPYMTTGKTTALNIWTIISKVQPHESQHARPPCPSQTPSAYSNSCPSSRWCHPAISSSDVPFSSCPQSLSASGSFPMSQPFAWGGQSIGVSASTSVLSMNTRDWSPLGWTGWISLECKGLLKSLLQHHGSKASFFQHSAFFTVQLSHPYMTTGKTIALARWTFFGKVMPLFFNLLSRLVITFLPRSKHLLILWLQSPSAVILEPQKIKSDIVSTVSPSIS